MKTLLRNYESEHIFAVSNLIAILSGQRLHVKDRKLFGLELLDFPPRLNGVKFEDSVLTYARIPNVKAKGLTILGCKARGAGLQQAKLVDADIIGSDFSGANLYGARIENAEFSDVDLSGALMFDATFEEVIFRGVDFSGAEMIEATFKNVSFHDCRFVTSRMTGVTFENVSFRRCDFTAADLRESCFKEVKYDHTVRGLHPAPEGELTGWGKKGGKIVKLRIPKEARRSCATTRKFRAEFAEVLEVEGGRPVKTRILLSGGGTAIAKYVPGEIVRCHEWDPDRWNECSGGIHFFLTREEAEQWSSLPF